MTENGFGINKKESIWHNYIGQWVTIRVPGIPTSYAGRVEDIREDHALLSPFQSGHYTDEDFFYEMSKGTSLIPLVGSAIEPTTEKNIIDYCNYMNKKSLEEKAKDKKSD
jgi:hypothetical protein